MSEAAAVQPKEEVRPVTTLLFDIDDTLYDVSTGFTAHRNGPAVYQYMVDRLGFPDQASAKSVRDEYFQRYHATAKALTIAEQEGKFPPLSADAAASTTTTTTTPRFSVQDLSEYWANNMNFDLLGGVREQFVADLQACQLRKVAFSNAPRIYAKRVLIELGLWEEFGEDRLFAVDDVLPHCKPEKEAFDKVFQAIGVTANECVMIEDSMKNIRRAKELGVMTVLVAGAGRLSRARGTTTSGSCNNEAAVAASEATKPGDAPDETDTAVDVAIETVDEMRTKIPSLWESPPTFRWIKR